jgi:hypothetical protein
LASKAIRRGYGRLFELRAINAWLKERSRLKLGVKSFFIGEQRQPMHRSTVNLALQKYSAAAALPSPHIRICCATPAPLRSATRELIRG